MKTAAVPKITGVRLDMFACEDDSSTSKCDRPIGTHDQQNKRLHLEVARPAAITSLDYSICQRDSQINMRDVH